MAAATTSSGGWRSRRRDGRQPFIPELDCLKEPEHDERCGFDGLNDQDPMLPGHKESNKEYHRPGRNRGEAREIDNSVRGVIAFGGQEHHNAGKDEHSDGRVAVRVCVEAGWPPSVPEEPNHHDQAAAKRGPPKLGPPRDEPTRPPPDASDARGKQNGEGSTDNERKEVVSGEPCKEVVSTEESLNGRSC